MGDLAVVAFDPPRPSPEMNFLDEKRDRAFQQIDLQKLTLLRLMPFLMTNHLVAENFAFEDEKRSMDKREIEEYSPDGALEGTEKRQNYFPKGLAEHFDEKRDERWISEELDEFPELSRLHSEEFSYDSKSFGPLLPPGWPPITELKDSTEELAAETIEKRQNYFPKGLAKLIDEKRGKRWDPKELNQFPELSRLTSEEFSYASDSFGRRDKRDVLEHPHKNITEVLQELMSLAENTDGQPGFCYLFNVLQQLLSTIQSEMASKVCQPTGK
uniref:Uncharacterized protein n=1 Tax=Panagrolaimus sp. JU765 TaxID=591449 RepID=A0AC34RTF1_9BILA